MDSHVHTGSRRLFPFRIGGVAPVALVLGGIANPCLAQPAHGKPHPVTLDLVVTDSANRPVTSLRAQDFEIFENGKKQTILSFHAPAEQVQPARQPAPTLPPNTFSNGDAFPPSSIEIILLDQLNTSEKDQELALRSLREMVKQKPPGAAFSIFTLRSDDPACSPFNYAESQFGIAANSTRFPDWSCLNRGQLLMIQGITEDKERLLKALEDLVRPRPTWMRSYPGSGRGGPPMAILMSFMGGMEPPENQAPPEVYDTSISALSDLGEVLRDVPGRKGLIWIADSFDAEPVAQYFSAFFLDKFKNWEKTNPLSSTQLLHLAADRFTQDRVALYPANLFAEDKHVEVKFICPRDFGDPLDALVSSLNASPTAVTKQSMKGECGRDFMKLSTLASTTGGRAFSGAEAIQKAFAQAVSDDSTHYSFVYFPKDKKYDSKVRKIRVAFTGKDKKSDKLAYRRTYFADDPSTLYPDQPDEQHVYITDPSAPILSRGRVVRVSEVKTNPRRESNRLPDSSLRYGAPETNGIIFTAHVAPTGPFKIANAAQMEVLGDNPSFTAERVQKAVNAVSKDRQWQRKNTATLDALPPSDPVSLQPYSIDFSLAPGQLSLVPQEDGEAVDLEIAVVAYDATGKRVTDLESRIHEIVAAGRGQQFKASEFRFQQDVQIPDRVTVLRFAVCDIATGHTGSLEVPVWAIASPYRRHRLPLPSTAEDDLQ
jgi:VWFA-related protein